MHSVPPMCCTLLGLNTHHKVGWHRCFCTPYILKKGNKLTPIWVKFLPPILSAITFFVAKQSLKSTLLVSLRMVVLMLQLMLMIKLQFCRTSRVLTDLSSIFVSVLVKHLGLLMFPPFRRTKLTNWMSKTPYQWQKGDAEMYSQTLHIWLPYPQ